MMVLICVIAILKSFHPSLPSRLIPTEIASKPYYTSNVTFLGPEGGEVFGIASSRNSNTVAAITYRDIYYKRTNSPSPSWVPANQLYFKSRTFDLKMQSEGVRVFADTALLAILNDTAYVSRDGQVWLPTFTFNTTYVASFDRDSRYFFVLDRCPITHNLRLWFTSDFGSTFIQYSLIPGTSGYDPMAIDFPPNAPQTIYIACRDWYYNSTKILYTSDGGNTWQTVQEFSGMDVYDIEINPYNTNEIFLATENGIFLSSSATGPWTLDNYARYMGIFYSLDIEFLNGDSILVASLLKKGVFLGVRSSVSPGTWLYTRIYMGGCVTDICLSSDGIYCATLGRGVIKSPYYALNFTEDNAGLHANLVAENGASQVYGQRFAFTSFGGRIFYTPNLGDQWQICGNFMLFGLKVEIAPNNPNFMVASAIEIDENALPTGYALPRTLNLGQSWEFCDTFTLQQEIPEYYDAKILELENIVLYLGSKPGLTHDYGVLRSVNYGASPILVLDSLDWPSNLSGINPVFVGHFDYDNARFFLFKSTNFGGSFDTVFSDTIPVRKISFDRVNNAIFIAGSDGYLYKYNLLTNNLEQIEGIFSVYDVDCNLNGETYVLTRDAIYYSNNGGINFYSSPVPGPGMIYIRSCEGGKALLYQDGRGFYRVDYINLAENRDLRKFRLIVTKNQILLKDVPEGKYEFSLFEVCGRQVKSWKLESTSARNNITLDLPNLPSGVYIYTIKGAGEKDSGRILILR
ncbi:MAG: T9SS type A sorting domain-containing protein [candidate division WOR-3 bacterium]